MTVVVSSHLLSEIDQMADHVAIIREGELVFQDTLAALHGRSRHHLALRTTNNALAAQVLREKGIGWTEEGDYLVLPILPDEQAAGLCRCKNQSLVPYRTQDWYILPWFCAHILFYS